MMRKEFIIETNICVVANRKSPQADLPCIISAIELLKSAYDGIVYIDAGNKIFNEYKKNLSFSGQPGLGDYFFKYLHENQAVLERCIKISINAKKNDPDDYEEFPDDPELRNFHRKDRKWVAVALANGDDPTIYNAVDSDWCEVPNDTWKRVGVKVITICPQCIK